jgi:AcrR family transcriptional regulator
VRQIAKAARVCPGLVVDHFGSKAGLCEAVDQYVLDLFDAFLMTNDLAILLLREHLADVLGADPLAGEGPERWAREMLTVYTSGLLIPPGIGPEVDQE